MKLFFVIVKLIGTAAKNDSLHFHSKNFCDLSVIITIAVQSTVVFGNAQVTL